METKTEVIYDNGTTDFCFSLKKQKYIEFEGQKIYLGVPERLAVYPGDVREVESFAPELLPIMQTFWTDDVVNIYKNKKEKWVML